MLVDNEDYNLLSKYRWFISDTGYAVSSIWENGKSKRIRAHRLILNAPTDKFCDHINLNKLDNRKSNLRLCSNAENMRNRMRPDNNTTGFKGIKKHWNKWMARIKFNYKEKYLGLYETKEEAAQAYNKAAKKYFGEFANFNSGSIKIPILVVTCFIGLGLLFSIHSRVFGLSVFTVEQGGTGASTLTGCLQGNGTGAITGSGSPCGSSGGSDPFTHPSSSISATTTTLQANSFINSNGDVLGQQASVVVSTTTATGQYTDIQSAINALPSNGGIVYIRSGTYTLSSGISINKSNVTLQGEGLKATTIQCDGSSIGICMYVATSSSLSQIKIRDIKLLQTNATNQGVGLDISDTPNVYVDTIRIESFATSTRKFDSTNTSFYGQVNNLISFDSNTCIELGGTQANDNMWTNVRCRPKSGAGGFGVYMIDARNNNFYNLDVEPSSAGTITGVYVGSTARDNSFYGSWIEANSVGVNITSGANNISFFGGTIGSNTTDITDNGTNSSFLGVNRNGTKLFTLPALTMSGITGSTQCLHVNSSGVVSGTTSDCGSGGGATDFPINYSWGNATSTTLGFLNGFLSTASSTIVGQTALMGNVGIGTSSPVDTLHVVGNLKFGYGRDNTYHSGYRAQITDNPLSSSATTINVNSTYQMPNSGTIQIENELIYYNGITSTSFQNCIRGVLGTTAASHVLNTSVGNVFMTMEANDTYPLIIASNYDPAVTQTGVRVGINSKIPAATLDVYKQSPAANDVLFQVGSSNQGGQLRIIDAQAPIFGIGLKISSLYLGVGTAYDKIYSGQNGNNFLDFSVGANTVLSSIQNVVLKNAVAGYGVAISTTTTAMPFVSYSSTLPQLSLSEGAGKSLWTFRNLSENLYFSTSTVAGNATSTNPAFGIDNNGNVKVGNAVPYYGTGGNTALVCYMSDGSLGHITITSALASGNCVQN